MNEETLKNKITKYLTSILESKNINHSITHYIIN